MTLCKITVLYSVWAIHRLFNLKALHFNIKCTDFQNKNTFSHRHNFVKCMRILGSLTDPIKPIMILTVILMVLGET